jgi:ABC-type glycerol-3-phosphate transport system substrate-binding protein
MSLKRVLILLGVVLLGAVVLAACGGAQQGTQAPSAPAATAAPTEPALVIPFKDAFLASGHANATDEPFTHWDSADPAEVPVTCAKCHTSAGFQEFVSTG